MRRDDALCAGLVACYQFHFMDDLRFSTALQLMLSVALAQREGIDTLPSSTLAEGLAANPALVRKLIVPLVDAGLLQSSRGKLGGVGLARAADRITFADIYRAVISGKKLFSQRQDVPHRCLVSSNIECLLDSVEAEADDALNSTLQRHTLASSLSAMDARSKGRTRRRA